MAMSDEVHYGYVKQVALDWRETARERRNMDVLSSCPSMVSTEKSSHRFVDSKNRVRVYSKGNAVRRKSSFYHQPLSGGRKSVEIERGEGNTESDRIRVSTDVSLYLHQPIPLNNAIRTSLDNAAHAES